MKKYALIIPVHLAKINWYTAFLHSIDKDKLQDLDFDLIILSSNLQEQAKFLHSLQIIANEYLPYIKVLDIDTYVSKIIKDYGLLDRYRKNTDKCIVNLKKFAAMHWAMSQNYEYMAVADCDIIFRDSNSTDTFFTKCIENYNKNMHISAPPREPVDVLYQICKHCSQFFSEAEQDILQKLTNGFLDYPWFFDIPFYKKDDLILFFEYMQARSPINFWLSLIWHSFEHIIFQYWRLLYCNSKYINVKHIATNPLEHATIPQLIDIFCEFNYMPVWLSLRCFINNAGLQYPPQEILMFKHTDRI